MLRIEYSPPTILKGAPIGMTPAWMNSKNYSESILEKKGSPSTAWAIFITWNDYRPSIIYVILQTDAPPQPDVDMDRGPRPTLHSCISGLHSIPIKW